MEVSDIEVHAPSPQSSIYEPLEDGEIRILHLQPATSLDTPLAGRLQQRVRLKDVYAYEALSYAWDGAFQQFDRDTQEHLATQLPRGEVYLDECLISITGNLNDALRRLRHADTSRALWLDALCINQDDLSERSSQVAKMARIYSNASQVIMWVGEESAEQDGEHFFDCCRRHNEIIKSRFKTCWRRMLYAFLRLERVRCSSGYLQRQYMNVPLLTWRPFRQVKLLDKFLDRRYFSRRWCVQELVVAKDIMLMCGARTMAWNALDAIVDINGLHEGPFNPIWQRQFEDLYRIRHRHFDALQLLTQSSWYACRDERDRIYSLASLLKRRPDCPVVDVNYHLPWITVYIHFARDYIMHNRLLETWRVLLLAALQYRFDDRGHELPSWVPDWRRSAYEPPHENGEKMDSAQSSEDYGYAIDHNDETLQIRLTYHGTWQEWRSNHLKEYQDSDCLYGLQPKSRFKGLTDSLLVLRPCDRGAAAFTVVGMVYEWEELQPSPRDEHEISIF